ncbi:MAG: DUF433 domain-containing protein [Planktothrix sp. GU0601_MAG3]|nr:MAG: DUF433 domain-containing protein [Planktothrix sp. GU0601_MAG3]
MSKNFSVISISTEIMGGTPVFVGTRVPIQTLFDYLEAGESINDFLDGFPTVSREQIIALLEAAKKLAFEKLQEVRSEIKKRHGYKDLLDLIE